MMQKELKMNDERAMKAPHGGDDKEKLLSGKTERPAQRRVLPPKVLHLHHLDCPSAYRHALHLELPCMQLNRKAHCS